MTPLQNPILSPINAESTLPTTNHGQSQSPKPSPKIQSAALDNLMQANPALDNSNIRSNSGAIAATHTQASRDNSLTNHITDQFTAFLATLPQIRNRPKRIVKGEGVYEGNMLEGRPSGAGKVTLPCGIFEGTFRAGVPMGYGTLTTQQFTYHGTFVNGRPDGHGEFRYTSGFLYGLEYVGEWCDGRRHGMGVETIQNLRSIEGEWVHGTLHGSCTMRTFGHPIGNSNQRNFSQEFVMYNMGEDITPPYQEDSDNDQEDSLRIDTSDSDNDDDDFQDDDFQ